MIEITHGFTSISAGSDSIGNSSRALTGARVFVEFARDAALAPNERVRVRYEFGGDGTILEADGIAVPTRKVVRWGRPVVFHYRMTHWIAPSALTPMAPRRPLSGSCETPGDPIPA